MGFSKSTMLSSSMLRVSFKFRWSNSLCADSVLAVGCNEYTSNFVESEKREMTRIIYACFFLTEVTSVSAGSDRGS